MRIIYPNNSLCVFMVKNGFVAETKGNREEQEDNLDEIYVFDAIDKLKEFIGKYFDEKVSVA